MNVQISRPLSSVSPAVARALVRIVIVGHVDHGKSTLIGRLLHETDGLPDGKLDALKARFRDHTIRIFNTHDMTSIGYWIPQDAPLSQNTLVYVLAHPSREDAKKNWAAFQADPEWVKAKAESEKDGKNVEKAESVFMDPDDFSQIK